LSGLLALAIGIAAGGLRYGLSLLVWGTLVRTVWVWHCTWSVNSFTHLFSYRSYAVPNDSRNLWWVALTTFGEGWHNSPHALAGNADFGHKWFELDPTCWVLTALERLGWAERIHRSKRIKQGGPPLKISERIPATSPAMPSRLTASRQGNRAIGVADARHPPVRNSLCRSLEEAAAAGAALHRRVRSGWPAAEPAATKRGCQRY